MIFDILKSQKISVTRAKVAKTVNNGLIDLYWNIGKYISNKTKMEGWGNGTVQNLSEFLKETEPNSKGFSSQNLWRMKQFYETYYKNEKLSLLVREIGWTNNMLIVSQTKSEEEQEFYMKITAKEKYSTEELINLIKDLPIGKRTVFNLYVYEGYSHKEIGEILNISENTSKYNKPKL